MIHAEQLRTQYFSVNHTRALGTFQVNERTRAIWENGSMLLANRHWQNVIVERTQLKWMGYKRRTLPQQTYERISRLVLSRENIFVCELGVGIMALADFFS
jgi:hypothetical protein